MSKSQIQTTKETYDYQSQLTQQPEVKAFRHAVSYTFSYVVADPETKRCAIIDSVLDYDLASGTLSYESAEDIIKYVKENEYIVEWHLETHMHADHLSAATYLREKLGGKVAIGNHISDIQGMYQDVFQVSADELETAKNRFDKLWEDFEVFTVGSITAFTFYAPGHTPADLVYGIGDALFVGDSLFMPDFGSARCDFPGGSAATMYDSVQSIYRLPESMRMFMCHDYLPEGRSEYRHETTVAEQKQSNKHLNQGVTKDGFVAQRDARDATLSLPTLMIPSLQVNVRAGRLPEQNGVPMLSVPINSIFSKYAKN